MASGPATRLVTKKNGPAITLGLLTVFPGGVVFLLIDQPSDERGEIGRDESDAVIVLLIDIHDTRLALLAAFAVVEHDHLMTRRWRVGDAHADGRVSPFFFPEFRSGLAA